MSVITELNIQDKKMIAIFLGDVHCSANVLVRISVFEANLMQPASTYSIMVCKSL